MNVDYSYLFDFIRQVYGRMVYSNKDGSVKLMPMRYVLELTYECNLRCPFCYITENRTKEELTTEEWFKIIDQIPPFALLSFVAGEVILKKDFIKIFEKASEKFRKISLISNGMALNEDIIDAFIKRKLFLLSVSLDGYGKNHDRNRNCNGLWDKVTNNLELFNSKRNGKSFSMLDIKTCVLDSNLDDLPILYKEAMKMNAQFFSLTFIRKQPLRQNSRLWETFSEDFYSTEYPIELYFNMEHFLEVYRELESMAKKSKTILRYAPRFNSIGDSKKIENFFKSGNKPVVDLYKPCNIPMSSIHITPEGGVYPCLSYKVGDLKTMSLKEAVNSQKLRCFRKNLYASKVFTGCQNCCDLIPKNQ